MRPENKFFSLFEHPFAWAQDARESFIKDFQDKDVARFLGESGEVTVALFGKTQVGKTTLLLRLLGAEEPHKVAEILRGGRKVGMSATSTAMVYLQSSDNKWRIDEGRKTNLYSETEKVREHLRHLRERRHAHPGEDTEHVEVHLPKVYFRASSEGVLRVRILDLPGIESDDPKEREHVGRLVKKYVPVADLILLVGMAHDLGFLDEVEIPSINDWRLLLRRFRIVVTRTVSARSTQEAIKTNIGLDKSWLRELIRNQSKTRQRPIPEEASIYPLEYGQSWDELKEKNLDLFSKAKPVMDELFQDLFEDIKNSATLASRIMLLTQVSGVIKKLREQKLTDFDIQIEANNCNISGLIKKIETFKIGCKEQISIEESLEQDRISFAEIKLHVTKFFSPEIHDSIPSPNEKSVRSLRKFLDKNEIEVSDMAKKTVEQWGHGTNATTISNEVMDCYKKATNSISVMLKSYYIDKYLSSDNFKSDRKKCIDKVNTAYNLVRESITGRIEDSATYHNNIIDKKIKGCQDMVEIFQQQENFNIKELRKVSKEKINLRNKRTDFLKKINDDGKQAEGFLPKLGLAFRNNYNSFIAEIESSEICGSAKLFLICHLYATTLELNKLVTMCK